MLDGKFYDILSRLRLQMAHKSSLNMSGSRKSVQKGISAEFSDFREYMPGDDLRRMDWNVYARLDKLYIREYMEEKEAIVSVLIDTSASMDYGAESKAELASDLAAVVGFLALNNMDRLMLYDMKDMGRALSVGGGRNAFSKVLRWLEGLSFSGEVDMLSAVRKMRLRGPGVTVIISDFLHPDMAGVSVETDMEGKHERKSYRGNFLKSRAEQKSDDIQKSDDMQDSNGIQKSAGGHTSYEKLLQYLDYCKQRPVILHTLAEEELHITLEGELNLIDAENNSRLRLTMDAGTIDCYEKELKGFTERMKKGCASGRGAYVLCSTGRDRKQLVFEDLRVIYDI